MRNKIIIAPDSFKGSLSSIEAGKAISEAVAMESPDSMRVVLPLADGGEGTVDAIVESTGGIYTSAVVSGPMGKPAVARYGINGTMAVIEVAAACGLTLVPESMRDPWASTSFGVGSLILDAIGKGCRDFIIGLGGSATNDTGIGMLRALGYRFLDENGAPVSSGGGEAGRIVSIDSEGVIPELREASFTVACDVTSPLCGPQGASLVFAPQKGADEEMAARLDSSLRSFAERAATHLHADYSNAPGAGAAGGLGFAFKAFLNAHLRPGVEMVLNSIGFDSQLEGASLVITGEGKLDVQTCMGKAPYGVMKRASLKGIPTIAIGGSIDSEAVSLLEDAGFYSLFPIVPAPGDPVRAMNPDTSRENIKRTVRQIIRTIRLSL